MSVADRVLYFRKAPHDNYLVFAPPDRALFIDRIHRAISESNTWGEFRQRMPPDEYRKLYAEIYSSDPEVLAEDEDAREPGDGEAFPHDVPGYCDGDYPPWLAKEQARYLPDDVLNEFAIWDRSVINGRFWRLDAARAELVAERLTRLGYQVERRDDLQFW
jgi:hypothetical protein